MAVLMQARLSGLNEEQYEQVTSGDFMERIRAAHGFVGLHAGGPVDGGYQVFEVWESEADHQSWVDQAIAPNMPPEAMEAMEITYHPLHNVVV